MSCMNIKARLERAAENKQWVKVYFHDASGIVGRIVRVGQDYVEIESYGFDDTPDSRNFAKNVIPLNFIKMFTVESSNFAEAERKRLEYLSCLESNVAEVVLESENS